MQRLSCRPKSPALWSRLLQEGCETCLTRFIQTDTSLLSAFEGLHRRILRKCSSVCHLQLYSTNPGQTPRSSRLSKHGSLFGTVYALGQPTTFPASEMLPNALFYRSFSRRSARSPVSQFFKRTEGALKICKLLMERTWDPDTADAVSKLDVHLSAYVACEVLRSPIPVDTALSFFNWLQTKDDFKPDSYVYNTIINRLGMAGRFEEMEAVANACKSDGKATIVTITSLIASYTKAGNIEGALRTWNYMEEVGLPPNVITYTTMIDLFAKVKMYEEAGNYYLKMLQERRIPNVRTCTVLINHLVESGKMDAAFIIFNKMVEVKIKPNPVTYTTVMIGYAKAGDLDMVLKLARQFKDYGHRPRPLGRSFSPLLKFLLNEGRTGDAEKVMDEIWPESPTEEKRAKVLELQTSLKEVGCSLNEVYSPVGSDTRIADTDSESDDAEEQDPGAHVGSTADPRIMWNMNSFVNSLTPWKQSTANSLENANVNWNGQLVSDILKRLRKAGVAWKFFCWVREQPGFNHDNYTYSRMIQLLLGAGDLALAKQLLEEAQQEGVHLSLHTYNNTLKYCGIKRDANVALEVFDQLKESGLKPDETTFKRLIYALYKAGRHWRAATIFSKMRRAGFQPDVKMYTLLIRCFGVAGEVKMAKAVYRHMRESGIEPNEHTFMAIINAYYEVGNLAVAQQLFQRMKGAGIRPSLEICNLMIKVFNTAGRLVEASKLEEESKSLVSTQATGKVDWNQFLFFHTIFVRNLTNGDKLQSLAVG